MAVNVYTGSLDPIKLALTIGRDKTPIDAAPLNRVKLELINRVSNTVSATVDSNVDFGVFFWNRTRITVKGVPDIYLLEMELQDEGLPIGENFIARLTLYDGANPLGIPWKQFALNSR